MSIHPPYTNTKELTILIIAPIDKGSKLEETVRNIRIRKGLKPEIPALDSYYDKL